MTLPLWIMLTAIIVQLALISFQLREILRTLRMSYIEPYLHDILMEVRK
jgi:multisubunit Na+/H+ antiporter MnhC subunit